MAGRRYQKSAATPRVLAALAGCLWASLAVTGAGAIENGVEPAADDAGARATVIVTAGKGSCSGLVYGDSFILTAGHCLLGRDFNAPIAPQALTVTYGRSLHPADAPTRQATALVVHENLISQFAAEVGDRNTAFENMPVNAEDIGLIRIAGTHPPGALGAALPTINNDYAVCCLARERAWPLVWMDVYGFGAAPKGEALHKARVSAAAPDMVRPGKEPNADQPYLPRQLLVTPEAPVDAPRPHPGGVCSGDSGGPAFFVTTSRSYALPDAPLKLVGGQPLAIGLVSHTVPPHATADAPAPDIPLCSPDFLLMRLDYYRDWIVAKAKQL